MATWTPQRHATALEYADLIEDEDQGPEDRAADRAERFAEYREKRTGEAVGFADRFDAAPSAHGYQSATRAERAARRHDRLGDYASDAWSKAEYWQRRTAGVIAHALHMSSPGVRMGRIKTIEADLRKHRAGIEERARNWRNWQKLAAITDAEQQTAAVRRYVGTSHQWSEYPHPDAPESGEKFSLYSLMTSERRRQITGAEACALWLSNHSEPATEDAWTRHYELRLAYENQMLEAQGGRAAFVEMVPGGWIGKHQIRKVNKSPATGRVVSVTLKIPGARYGSSTEGFHLRAFNVERLPQDAYTPPSAEDLATLNATKAAEKAAAPAKAPCPLINPTDTDAEHLQERWNEIARAESDAARARGNYVADFTRSEVLRMTQAQYAANSGGTYSSCETRGVCADGVREPRVSNLWTSEGAARAKARGPALCKVRICTRGSGFYTAPRVIVITDKPQKPLPAAVWQPRQVEEQPTAPAEIAAAC